MGLEILVAATLITGVVGAYGQYQAAQQQKRVSDFNAAIARNNAISAKQWSDYNETRTREQQAYRRSRMVSQYLKSGVTIDPDTSPALVLEEQLVQDELEALSVRRGGETSAMRARNQATIYGLEGEAARQAGNIGAATTLLTAGVQAGTLVYDSKGKVT